MVIFFPLQTNKIIINLETTKSMYCKCDVIWIIKDSKLSQIKRGQQLNGGQLIFYEAKFDVIFAFEEQGKRKFAIDAST